jgi:hypothetical protein
VPTSGKGQGVPRSDFGRRAQGGGNGSPERDLSLLAPIGHLVPTVGVEVRLGARSPCRFDARVIVTQSSVVCGLIAATSAVVFVG